MGAWLEKPGVEDEGCSGMTHQHRAGDGSYLVYDRSGMIPIERVCDECRQEKLRRWGTDVEKDRSIDPETMAKYMMWAGISGGY